MKIGTAVLLGVGVWATYELYKTRSLSLALASMKGDIVGLKSKMADMSDKSVAKTPDTVASNQVAPAIAAPANGVWGNFIGQQAFTEIVVPNDYRAVQHYSGTDYNSVFRSKPVALNQFAGW